MRFLPGDTPGLAFAVSVVSYGVAGVASPIDMADHVEGSYDIVLRLRAAGATAELGV